MEKTCGETSSCISDMAAAYLDTLRSRNYSPKSIKTYGEALSHALAYLKSLGIVRAQDTQEQHIVDYRLKMIEAGLKPASIQTYMRGLKLFFKYLEDSQSIFVSPMDGMSAIRADRPLGRVPDEDEIQRLLAAPDTAKPTGLRDRALLETVYSTALRRQELLGLKAADVDLSNASIRVMGKGSRERVVPLGRHAVCWIARYVREARATLLQEHQSEMLWIGRNSKPLSYSVLPVILRTQCRRAGIAPVIAPHAIRRACATHMLRNGASAVQVQALLGHASMRHLSQYLRVTISELRTIHAGSKVGA